MVGVSSSPGKFINKLNNNSNVLSHIHNAEYARLAYVNLYTQNDLRLLCLFHLPACDGQPNRDSNANNEGKQTTTKDYQIVYNHRQPDASEERDIILRKKKH